MGIILFKWTVCLYTITSEPVFDKFTVFQVFSPKKEAKMEIKSFLYR